MGHARIIGAGVFTTSTIHETCVIVCYRSDALRPKPTFTLLKEAAGEARFTRPRIGGMTSSLRFFSKSTSLTPTFKIMTATQLCMMLPDSGTSKCVSTSWPEDATRACATKLVGGDNMAVLQSSRAHAHAGQTARDVAEFNGKNKFQV